MTVEAAEQDLIDAEAEMVVAARELEAAERNLARTWSKVESAKGHLAYQKRLQDASTAPDPI